MAGGGILLQSAATTGNGSVVNCFGSGGEYLFEIVANGTVSGGAVQFEEAASSDYSGTWTAIDLSQSPATSTRQAVRKTGSYSYVRARITSNITGGGSITARVYPPRFGGES